MKSIMLLFCFAFLNHIISIQKILPTIYSEVYIYSYWILLGFLSSVGLGSGLHTFTLYLVKYNYQFEQICL